LGAADHDPDAPPAPPDGHVVGPPDFVGVGAQKSGTTWWYDLVAAHPGVHHAPGRPKELHAFDRHWAEPLDERGIGRYHDWFARPPGMLAGEWTPRYLHDWWVPPLLARAAPSARVLVLLRDPVERYRSGVAHELRSRGRRDPAIAGDALRRSCYAAQLERLWRSFPREQVLVLQFERCVADPIRELRRTYAFLGLDADVVPPDPERPRHVTHDDRPELPSEVHAALLRELADDLRRLRELVPDLDPERWPSSLGADRAAALPFADTPSGDAPTTST
jgi:hypothetical protein